MRSEVAKKFYLQEKQLPSTILHTLVNLTQQQGIPEWREARVEEMVDGMSSTQPDTTSLVILLAGSLVLFLFYLGLKYYTTDSFRWLSEIPTDDWTDASGATAVRRRRGICRPGREPQAPRCSAWLLSLPGSFTLFQSTC